MIKKIQKIFSIIIVLIILFGMNMTVLAQVQQNILDGTVSYISGKNIYVKFENTLGIENNDTLFYLSDEALIPALIVQHHSSISCLCNPLENISLKVSDKIIGKISIENETSDVEVSPANKVEQDVNIQALNKKKGEVPNDKNSQKIDGRFSVSSYSNFSNTKADDTYRFRYTFSLDAKNISDSKFSAETYISFSHKLNQWDLVKENLNNALKIYSLAVKYDFNPTMSMWAGRKINTNLANVGAIDGLQFQKEWKHFFAGLAAGTRPDYLDYGFNPNLLEYGAYIGQNEKVENGFVQTSLAFFEQRNQSNIDRRFVYFQHSNSYFKNVSVFSSFEIDLYKVENGQPSNTISLTGLYFSVRYRVNRRMSVFGSYDNRKNVIYYETYKNYTDAILQQASRQGVRFRINYRPLNLLNLGFDAGTRFMKDDPRKTNTLNGNATYSNVPGIKASLSVSANLMQTSYLDGQVYGARLMKDIIPGKIYGTLNYRWVKFDYLTSNSQLKQNIGEIDFSYRFNKKLYLSVNFESTFQKSENFNRVYLNLRWKF